MTTTIIALGLLYFTGHLLNHFFDRTKVPDVLILILFGIALGPLFHIIDPESIGAAGSLLTSVALIIILFDGGLGLELGTLIRSAKQALLLTGTFFIVSVIITFCIMFYGFEFSSLASIIMGFICGGTASAVIIPLIGHLNVGKEASSILIIESAVTTVLCVVSVLGILDSYNSGDFEVGHIIGNLIASIVLASFVGLIGGIIWLRMINWIRTIANTQFATFAFMFIIYGLAEILQFSGPIAALAFGIVLGNHKPICNLLTNISSRFNLENVGIISDAERKLYKEIVFLIKIFFFVYLGICIPFERTYTLYIAFTVVIAVYLARPLVTKLLVRRRTFPYDNSVISIMVPKGLASAVLAGLPLRYGMIEGNDIQAIVYHIILVSIVLTSVLTPLLNNTFFGRMLHRFFRNKNNSSSANIQGK